MTMTISGSTGLTFPDDSVQALGSYTGFKNRIINGAMVIDQRNAGASVTITNTSAYTYTLDRWAAFGVVTSKFSVQQDAGAGTLPVGFNDYLGATSLSAYTVGSSETFLIAQFIEGYNIADLGWGTANAQTVTLSFRVRSSLTGTFGGSIQNSAQDRSYPFIYTILAANTWETKSITITGDTSGTWLVTNGIGMRLFFSLGTGSTISGTAGSWAGTNYVSATGATSVVGTNGATFQITGVQLEKGSTATSFDYRPYGTELALCQRYLPALNNITSVDQIGNGYSFLTTQALISINHTVTARVPPTGITITNPANISVGNGSGAQSSASAGTFIYGGVNQTMISFTVSGFTIGQGCYARSQGAYQILFNGCEL